MVVVYLGSQQIRARYFFPLLVVYEKTQRAFYFLKKLWCRVGGRVRHENLVLSNMWTKVKLPPSKIWKAEVSSVSPSSE